MLLFGEVRRIHHFTTRYEVEYRSGILEVGWWNVGSTGGCQLLEEDLKFLYKLAGIILTLTESLCQ